MATINGTQANPTFTQTMPAAPVAPSATSKFDMVEFAPFIRQLVAPKVIYEPKMQQYISSARSFFRGNELIQDNFLLDNLQFGQEIEVIIENNQNPLNLFQSSALTYNELDTCRDMLSLNCEVPCINTLPSFDKLSFRLDTEYAYGVRACDKNRKFWDYNYFTRQYALSRDAERFGREVDLWNEAVGDAIANPAKTVDMGLAQTFATHYWADLGPMNANGIQLIRQAAWYMQSSFEDDNYRIVMSPELAHAIIASTLLTNPGSYNLQIERVNTMNQWDVPGLKIDEQVREVLGTQITVDIMIRSPWLRYMNGASLVSTYPLENTDATKQYVFIVNPLYAYEFAVEGYHLNILPYDCDKLVRGMIDTEYVGKGTTFPVYALLLEFDAPAYYGPTAVANA